MVSFSGLCLVAVYAPLLASDQPFVWCTDNGCSSPWLVGLFDRNLFENGVDRFFNALLLLGTPVALVLLLMRRPRVYLYGCAGLVLGVGVLMFVDYSRPVVDFRHAAGWGFFAPLRYSYRAINLDAVRLDPSVAHWLGTDHAGRDVMTRLLFGTRISLTVGIAAVSLYASVGTVVGAVAGYYGGRVDSFLRRLIEVVMAIPSLFLILTVAALIDERSVFQIVLVIAAVEWTTPARLVRAEFLRLRSVDFVLAARASGFSDRTIIFQHILPNAIAPVLVAATFGVAGAIMTESTMSFLGLGDITVPSWGQILNAGRSSGMWTLILAPGCAIFVTVSTLNLLGDGLRDALDPRLRN